MAKRAAARCAKPVLPPQSEEQIAGEPAQSPPRFNLRILYQKWSVEYNSIADLAQESGCSAGTIRRAIRRVANQHLQRVMKDLPLIRVRQAEALENVVRQALQRWNETFDVRYIAEVRKLMTEIRKIWGLDKPTTFAEPVDPSSVGLERVAGIDRATALRSQAERMLQVADQLTTIPMSTGPPVSTCVERS